MAITPTFSDTSLPLVGYLYTAVLVNGSNAIALPVPPAKGSFPVAGDWTPTVVLCFPYQTGGIGAVVTPDLTTIANSSGSVTFTVYAGGATKCLFLVA